MAIRFPGLHPGLFSVARKGLGVWSRRWQRFGSLLSRQTRSLALGDLLRTGRPRGGAGRYDSGSAKVPAAMIALGEREERTRPGCDVAFPEALGGNGSQPDRATRRTLSGRADGGYRGSADGCDAAAGGHADANAVRAGRYRADARAGGARRGRASVRAPGTGGRERGSAAR